MKVEYEIPDNLVQCFSDTAKDCLKKQSEKYSLDIIKEAEIDEQLYQVQGAGKEITQSNVLQAVKCYRVIRKKSVVYKIVRIIGEIGLFVSGLMFLPEKLVNSLGELDIVYFFIWLLVMLASIIITICDHFMGGE